MDSAVLLRELRAQVPGAKFKCVENMGSFRLIFSAEYEEITLKIQIPNDHPKSEPILFVRSSVLSISECQKLEEQIAAFKGLALEKFMLSATEAIRDCSAGIPSEKKPPGSSKASSSSKSKPRAEKAAAKQPETSKLPSMRTAADVIKRISWDPSLNIEDFIVGYLDRFSGVVEKPFVEFAWEKEAMTDTDPNVLAVPQHRIHYFKYKGTIVWDKTKRLDMIFGSTGSSSTLEDVQNVTGVVHVAGAAENVLKPESDSDSSSASSDELVELVVPFAMIRPNYFLAIPINNPSISKQIAEIQDCICAEDPSMRAFMTPINSLHCTLCTLVYRDENEVNNVTARAFAESAEFVDQFKSINISVRGINTFGNRVMYAGVEDNATLKDLARRMRGKFGNFVNRKDMKRDFVAHITFVKLPFSASLEDQKKLASAYSKLTQFHVAEIGVQDADTLHCSRAKKNDDAATLPFGYPIVQSLSLC